MLGEGTRLSRRRCVSVGLACVALVAAILIAPAAAKVPDPLKPGRLGVNVAVAYAVADRLARPSHEWRSFQPPNLLRPLYPGLAIPTDPLCAN